MNLQDVVDELAETLGRSVVINDLQFKPIAASAQGEDIDEVRARALLQRVTPPRERAHLESLRVTQARRPMTIDLSEFGARERLAIPIWDDERPAGVLWLVTGGLPALTALDLRAIDAAVDVARPLIYAHSGRSARTEGESVFRALLAPDPATRRRALATASRSHGFQRGPGSLITAVAVGYDTGVVQRVALARAIEGGDGRRLRFLGEHGATLVFLADAASAAGWEYFDEKSKQVGVLLRAVGTARMAVGEDELLPATERAAASAVVAEVLPDCQGIADADDVGPWLLVADIAAEPSRLAWYSPATHALVSEADPLRRQTVEAYLDGAGQVRAVCERLHIHRTTLYYRLENMPQVVRDALEDGMRRSALHIGLKLARYWQNSGLV